ncbi:hypothetical protein [Geothrix sp. 21YS21S-4]|uniref:hypothetical protein n=1 Tax=Geothrix sp. 21YS21S-4 TaxID=3068889 RepID=UPI0027B8FD62|nr:hypothetical protein [Geothrix sp. 21YS21S-4]
MRRLPTLAGGFAVWGLALALAWALPGALWKPAAPPPFPFPALIPAGWALFALALVAPLAAWVGGPALASAAPLALLEAPPDLLWAGLLLALWPAVWGPPGTGGWLAAFLVSALPGEIRWLSQALPPESPFPAAWGPAAVRRVRFLALRRLWGRWLAARLPVWLTATLVLERLLGVPGLGTDWLARVTARDRAGLAAWVGALALLWLVSQTSQWETP